MSKERMKIKKIGNALEINGKFYLYQGAKDKEYMIFEEIGNADEVNEFLENLINKLEPSLDKRIILKDVLCEMPFDALKKLDKILEKEKPVMKKTEGGCVELHVGKTVLDIR